MRTSLPCRFINSPCWRQSDITRSSPPLIHIQDGTFYRRHPSPNPTTAEREANKPLFPHLNFILESSQDANQHVAIVGPSNAGKTTLLQIFQGRHITSPTTARTYPYLSSQDILSRDSRLGNSTRAIQYVGFDEKQKGLSGMGSYLSARFESRKEQTDFKLSDYLRGRTQLNTAEEYIEKIDEARLSEVVADLRLEELLDMPVINLSNGQTRRARIAKALMSRPELLLLDEPFMGLDPPTTVEFNPILRRLAYAASPRIILALRPQDPIPSWVTDILHLGKPLKVTTRGDRLAVTRQIDEEIMQIADSVDTQQGTGVIEPTVESLTRTQPEFGRLLLDDGVIENPYRGPHASRTRILTSLVRYEAGDRSERTMKRIFSHDDYPLPQQPGGHGPLPALEPEPAAGETLLELDGVTIKYGDKPALGDWQSQLRMGTLADGRKCLIKDIDPNEKPGLQLTVKRGQRWAVIGPNGSGKTTLLSLITSDHPQAYSAPMKLFGRSRLPQAGSPGLSLFEIQSRIGQSSPEIHSFFPKHLSVRRSLESAWAETFLGRPKLSADADLRVDACLRWFREEMNPAIGPDPELHEEITTMSRGHESDELFKFQSAEKYRSVAWQRDKAEYQYQYHERRRDGNEWAETMRFGEMTFSGQRVALFLRAMIAQPDMIILDEALSGMDDQMRDKCLAFLEHGESRLYSPFYARSATLAGRPLVLLPRKLGHRSGWKFAIPSGMSEHQALVVVSHVPHEIPRSIRDWIFLPAAGSGQAAFTGHVEKVPLYQDHSTWNAIWGSTSLPVKTHQQYAKERADHQTVRQSRTPARPVTDAATTTSELHLSATQCYNTVRSTLTQARATLRRAKTILTGKRRVSRVSQRLNRIDREAKRLSSARRARWEAREYHLYSKDVTQLPGFVRTIEQRLRIIRNWTSLLKAELDDTLKSGGYTGFKRYQREFRLPYSLAKTTEAVRRSYLRLWYIRQRACKSIMRLYGPEAVREFNIATMERPFHQRAGHVMAYKSIISDEAQSRRSVTRLHKDVVQCWNRLSGQQLSEEDAKSIDSMLIFLRKVLPRK